MEIKLLDIKELGQLLGYSDLRSVRKWCAKNNLLIARQGKKEFVNKDLLSGIFEKCFTVEIKDNKVKKENRVGVYKPTNEIVSKYLKKYESSIKIKAA